MNNLKNKITVILTTTMLLLAHTAPVYAFDKELNSDLLLLVNKDYPILESYVPLNTENVSSALPSVKNKMTLRREAAQALKEMYTDMEKEGLHLNAVSGYRSYSYQAGLFIQEISKWIGIGKTKADAYKTASTVVAAAGNSEHQTGLAIDVSTNNNLTESFAKTSEGLWLKNNCYKYGFILRYAFDKQSTTNIIYEPWHFRYVGKPHSQYMYQNDICLEEYILLLKQQKQITIPLDDMQYHVYYTNNTKDNFDNILDISRDNTGGYIITTGQSDDPYLLVREHPSEKYIMELIPESKVTVYPDKEISEEEFIELLKNSNIKLDIEQLTTEKQTKTDYFTDVMKNLSIAISDGRSQETGMLTRQKAIKILSPLVDSDEVQRIHFVDIKDIRGDVFQDVQKFVALGFIKENEDNKLLPNEVLTLAQAAEYIYFVNHYSAN